MSFLFLFGTHTHTTGKLSKYLRDYTTCRAVLLPASYFWMTGFITKREERNKDRKKNRRRFFFVCSKTIVEQFCWNRIFWLFIIIFRVFNDLSLSLTHSPSYSLVCFQKWNTSLLIIQMVKREYLGDWEGTWQCSWIVEWILKK